jgi:hypothetical protein
MSALNTYNSSMPSTEKYSAEEIFFLPPVKQVVSPELKELREARESLALIRIAIRSMDRGVGYRNPYDHDTYGEYAEGKSDFAGDIEEILDRNKN